MGIKILSLFDGMACGMIAMLGAGIEVDKYTAYEIDKYAMKVATHNFPQIEERGDVFQADFTEYEGVDYVIGGSPCTYWSIAQKNNRETEASGMGWELFSQYVRAIREAKPKYFIYENNKSMSKQIRESITKAFGFEPVYINSALVSAQNRQRLYWVGKRKPNGEYAPVYVEQPEDRGIMLRDVLEGSAAALCEKAYTLRASAGMKQGNVGAVRFIETQGKYGYMGVAEPIGVGYRNRREADGKLYRRFETHGETKANALTTVQTDCMVAEPICINQTENGKSRTVDAHMGKLENCLIPRMNNDNPAKQQYDCIAEPVRIGTIESESKNKDFDSQQYRVYSPDGKSVTLCGNGGGVGAKTGLYATPCDELGICHLGSLYNQHSRWGVFSPSGKSPTITASMGMGGGHTPMFAQETAECGDCRVNPTEKKQIYEVRNGLITIKDKQYPIKLADGYYIIRKLTITECKRLQTVPEWYDMTVISNSQAYKCLGNGWTCEVITHLINATMCAETERTHMWTERGAEELQISLFAQ